MSSNFIVCPASRYFFTIEVRYVECTIDRIDPNHDKDFKYNINFDNYRHTKSGVQHRAPIWPDEKLVFIYETMYPHLLVSKLCRFSVFSSNGKNFVGDASIDVLTLATGPSRIALSLRNGDSVVGRIYITMKVNEVCQTVAKTTELTVSGFRGALASASKANLSVVVKKRASDESVKSTSTTFTKDDATFAVPDHLFSMDSESMLNLAGLLIELYHGGSKEGVASILFSDHLLETFAEATREPSNLQRREQTNVGENSEYSAAMPREKSLHPDSSDVRVEDPLDAVNGHHSTERKLRFSAVVRNDANVEIATVTGVVLLDRTITFAQMPDGVTVDGVVCGTPLPGYVRPPFLQGDLPVQEDENDERTQLDLAAV
ncbi:Hypothetical protein, putative [Bodo saltans]|uniref:Uncharacterized protein n=1 Tax=Bodo saltans TaxID=75058 RepID=A0A0S4JU87_BODSA|nr:Hypothetical protein, putative [Bodo saltans]|eukprot:CUG92128.1 Hypothetical protein, putative [Bodo saltans]